MLAPTFVAFDANVLRANVAFAILQLGATTSVVTAALNSIDSVLANPCSFYQWPSPAGTAHAACGHWNTDGEHHDPIYIYIYPGSRDDAGSGRCERTEAFAFYLRA